MSPIFNDDRRLPLTPIGIEPFPHRRLEIIYNQERSQSHYNIATKNNPYANDYDVDVDDRMILVRDNHHRDTEQHSDGDLMSSSHTGWDFK